jgi:4a-hydroxytetrahydrobiopterin dehydratase
VATVTLPIEHVEPWRAAVAAAADALDHHPALSVDGGVVEVVCTTHVPKGLTALDVALASTIEALAAEYGGGLGDG